MTARRRAAAAPAATDAPDPATVVPGSAPLTPGALDGLIHQRTRLGIVSALAVGGEASFAELKRALDTTDGNLSVHARKLEDAGYITCRKQFDGRVPKTEYALTAEGRRAFERYIDEMESLIRTMRPME